MKILGIETSCDETAISLIEAEGDFDKDFQFKILGNALLSQAKLHEQYGGVFPNLAKREHAKNLVPMLKNCLQEAGQLSPRSGLAAARPDLGVNLDVMLAREPELYDQLKIFLQNYARPDVDAIAVTHGPGLEPALWVGVNFARALSTVWNIPVVGVNHMEGHIVLSMMDADRLALFEFPVLALLISGGHTEIVLSRAFGMYELIGQTRDDAAGEAFDKVARLLGLPYPGGPHVSALAERARKNADRTPMVAEKILRESASSPHESALRLPRPMLHEDNFDFSFSGLKTAVHRMVENHQGDALMVGEVLKMQIAREFEDAVADVLVAKTLRATDVYGTSTVVVGGGVSANAEIRRRLASELSTVNCKLLTPPPELATDNAIMIALAGYFHAVKKEYADPTTLHADGNLRLA